ncbi:hypothetical protein KPH14_005356 [Odynerus spinipes]|uniref:Uncharacterized protein n=1 Tax=Odynerus spinipes TaxID=1348599 RepID=A0AAD9VK46_9HYME|nr:hypothetical protein KPH14_005356 [Odynerus spinipes]
MIIVTIRNIEEERSNHKTRRHFDDFKIRLLKATPLQRAQSVSKCLNICYYQNTNSALFKSEEATCSFSTWKPRHSSSMKSDSIRVR